jgi:hypothetical protein
MADQIPETQQMVCTECAGRFKLAMVAKFQGQEVTPQQMMEFSDEHPVQAPMTMAGGNLFCLEHLPVASQSVQKLLAPGGLTRGG